MKISLCCTVKDEKNSINSFLDTIMKQTKVPDEIIIVDGGSKDGTIEILNDYQHDFPELIKIIKNGEVNIAKGRNISIVNAKHEYIVSADAGTEYDVNWLKNLTSPFNDLSVDIVSGFFEPKTENRYEEVLGVLFFPKVNDMNWDKFLPSARSLSFKKKVWKELGGYAEWLPRGIGEDSLFAICAKKKGYNFAFAKDATCYWQPRSDLSSLFKQYFYYSQGAAIAGFQDTFLFESYGINPIKMTLSNFAYFITNKKFIHLIISVPVLTTVLFGKICGSFSGMIKRSKIKNGE